MPVQAEPDTQTKDELFTKEESPNKMLSPFGNEKGAGLNVNTQPTSGVSSFETSNTLECGVARTPLFLEDKDTATWKEQKFAEMMKSPGNDGSRSSEIRNTAAGREHLSFKNVLGPEPAENGLTLLNRRFNS